MAVADSEPFAFFIVYFRILFFFLKKGRCYIVTLFCYCCFTLYEVTS